MSDNQTTILRVSRRRMRLLGFIATACLVLLGFVVAASGAQAGGDNGDVKIHNVTTPYDDQRNEPKVCNPFYIAAFPFDKYQQVSWHIVQGTHGDTVASGTITLGADGTGHTANISLPQDNQYKLYWNWVGEKGSAKHKVFKVDCDNTPPPSSSSSSSSSTTSSSSSSSSSSSTTSSSSSSSSSSTTSSTPPAVIPPQGDVYVSADCYQVEGKNLVGVGVTFVSTADDSLDVTVTSVYGSETKTIEAGAAADYLFNTGLDHVPSGVVTITEKWTGKTLGVYSFTKSYEAQDCSEGTTPPPSGTSSSSSTTSSSTTSSTSTSPSSTHTSHTTTSTGHPSTSTKTATVTKTVNVPVPSSTSSTTGPKVVTDFVGSDPSGSSNPLMFGLGALLILAGTGGALKLAYNPRQRRQH